MARARQHCITCPRSDWRAMQALAKEAGMKTSPFILKEVLGEDCRMALTAEEQHGLHERTVRLASLGEELLRPLPGSEVTLGEALLFLWRDLQARQQEEAARTRRNGGVPRSGAGRPGGLPDLFGEGPQ